MFKNLIKKAYPFIFNFLISLSMITSVYAQGVPFSSPFYPVEAPLLPASHVYKCDGYTAADGGTTLNSNVFNSASASFSASTDVGKTITIAHAGNTFSYLTSTINAGGSGYKVGDTITLTGGTFTTAVTLAVTNVNSSGAVTSVSPITNNTFGTSVGLYTVTPANPVAQGSTSGTGTSATFNITWMTNNLVTTISAVNSATQVQLAANANATLTNMIWAFGTDVTSNINSALSNYNVAWIPNGSRAVGAGGCIISSTINLGSDQVLRGQGGDEGYALCRSALLWAGGPQSIMVHAGTTNTTTQEQKIYELCFNGEGQATIGLGISGAQQGYYDHLGFNNQTAVAMLFDANSATQGGSSFNYVNDVLFGYNAVSLNDTNSAYATLLEFGPGNGSNDTFGNYLINIEGNYQNGTAFLCWNADHNLIYNYSLNAGASGGGEDIDMLAASVSINSCRYSTFVGSGGFAGAASTGPHAEAGDGFFPSRDNAMYLYVGGNQPFPTIASGASLTYDTDTGVHWSNATASAFTMTGLIKSGPNSTVVAATNSFNNPKNITNPASTTSATVVMAGLNQTLTPETSGSVQFIYQGQSSNTTAGDGEQIQPVWGTGTAPANGAALTGNTCSKILGPNSNGTSTIPFTVSCTVTGLTAGTTYWFDLAYGVTTGGAAVLAQLGFNVHEE